MSSFVNLRPIKIISKSYYLTGSKLGASYIQLIDETTGITKSFYRLNDLSQNKKPKSDNEHISLAFALSKLTAPCQINIETDASKFVNAYNTKAFDRWKRNNFKKPINQGNVYREIDIQIHRFSHTIASIKVVPNRKIQDDIKTLIKQKIEDEFKHSSKYNFLPIEISPQKKTTKK